MHIHGQSDFSYLHTTLFQFHRLFQDGEILFEKRPHPRHHFVLWRYLFGHDPMAHNWNDVSALWIDIFIWTILSHCGTVDARYTRHWRFPATAGRFQLLCEFWGWQQSTSASLSMMAHCIVLYVCNVNHQSSYIRIGHVILKVLLRGGREWICWRIDR